MVTCRVQTYIVIGQSTYVGKKSAEAARSQVLEIVQCTDTSLFYTCSNGWKMNCRELKAREKICMVHGPERTVHEQNLQHPINLLSKTFIPEQDTTNHARPDIYACLLYVVDCCLVGSSCISRIYITNVSEEPGNSQIDIRGHAQKDFITICGIFPQAQPRSMGRWLISKPLWSVLHVARSIFLCIFRDFGQHHFCRHGNNQTGIPIKDMPFIRAR